MAHADIGKQGATHIHGKALHPRAVPVWHFALQDALLVEAFADIAPCPQLGDVLGGNIKFTGFKRFQPHGVIHHVAVQHTVKIKLAASDGQVFGPIVGAAAVLGFFAQTITVNDVGAAGEGGGQDALGEGLAAAPLPRKHRQLAQNQVKFGIAAFKVEAHGAAIQHGGTFNIAPIKAVARMGGAVGGQGVEAVFDIGGGDTAAVGEFGLGAQTKGDGQAIGGKANVFGQQPVHGERLV